MVLLWETESHKKVYISVWEFVSDTIIGHFSSPLLPDNKYNEILLNSIMISLPVVENSLSAKFVGKIPIYNWGNPSVIAVEILVMPTHK